MVAITNSIATLDSPLMKAFSLFTTPLPSSTATENFQHNKSQITLHIEHKKAHKQSRTQCREGRKLRSKREKKKLKFEPINKSNAKRIINNNWFENYGAMVQCVWSRGEKKEVKALQKNKVVMRLGNGLLMCDDCFSLLLLSELI